MNKKLSRKPRQKRQGIKSEHITKADKRSKEPVDYGITKRQFHEILDKASQPIKKPESDSETTQT